MARKKFRTFYSGLYRWDQPFKCLLVEIPAPRKALKAHTVRLMTGNSHETYLDHLHPKKYNIIKCDRKVTLMLFEVQTVFFQLILTTGTLANKVICRCYDFPVLGKKQVSGELSGITCLPSCDYYD